MLVALHIENIAIIDRLDIDFSKGFTVFTGETGAGKSIIIDSILLLLGNKASKELIRSGEEFGVVSGCFSELSSEALAFLEDNGLSPDEEGNLVVFRKIDRESKNHTRINGISVTVSFLRELGKLLINVHGQHDGVLLLDSKRHLGYLDEFGALDDELNSYSKLYQMVKEKRNYLSKLRSLESIKEQKINELNRNLEKLIQCDLKIGEHEELLLRRKNLMQNEEIISGLNVAVEGLYGGEESAAQLAQIALDAIAPIEKMLPDGEDLYRRLSQVSAELDDLGVELGKRFDDYMADRMDPDFIEKRLDELEIIKKEFGPDDQDVIDKRLSFEKELNELDQSGERLYAAENEFEKARKALEKAAENLSKIRKSKARELEARLLDELKYLDMPGVRFSIQVTPRLNERGGIRYRADGKDDVAFLLSSNVGEEMKPLSKIASGGELSRIMLSLKSVLNHGFDTVIYDEIDTGVSGATAEKIGKKLKESAENRQVFCITHLAQIAALGDHHMKVSKKKVADRVVSSVEPLSHEQRVNEIARIMGGEDLTETLLSSAREILKNS